MTEKELQQERSEFNEILLDQFHKTRDLLSTCDSAAIISETANRLLGYAQALLWAIGTNIAVATEINSDDDAHYSDEESAKVTPIKLEAIPKTTIEDIVAEEVKAVLDQPQTAVEEPTLTKEEVTNILRGLQLKHTTEPNLITDALKEFGATKLSQVPPEKYGDLVAAAKAKVGET